MLLKKSVCLLLALLLIPFFGSCKKQKNIVPAPDFNAFEMTADIQYGDMKLEAALTRRAMNLYRLSFTAPVELKGFTVDYDGEELSIAYMGLSFKTYPAALPDQSVFTGLFSVFNRISLGDSLNIKDTAQGQTLSGQSDSGAFTVTLNDDGLPKEISMPDIDLTAVIREFKAL